MSIRSESSSGWWWRPTPPTTAAPRPSRWCRPSWERAAQASSTSTALAPLGSPRSTWPPGGSPPTPTATSHWWSAPRCAGPPASWRDERIRSDGGGQPPGSGRHRRVGCVKEADAVRDASDVGGAGYVGDWMGRAALYWRDRLAAVDPAAERIGRAH